MFMCEVTNSEKSAGVGTPSLPGVAGGGITACILINVRKDLSSFIVFCMCLMLSLGFLFFQLRSVALGMLNRARHRQCIGMRALE